MMDKKSERLYIRVCPEDKELYKSLSKELNMNISQFIDFCITFFIGSFEKMNKSVSAEVYKQIKSECDIITNRMKYYTDNTEISNDLDIFRHISLIGCLAEIVSKKINE